MRGRLFTAIAASYLTALATSHASPAVDHYTYIPPAWSDAVVFLHRFEKGVSNPECNELGATVRGESTTPVSGLTGRGYQAPDQYKHLTSLQIDAAGLAVNRAITVMLWFRLDAPMKPETSFQLLKLGGGRGNISSFVRGKGDWAGLREPTRISQVWDFPGIINHNNTWGGPVAFRSGDWHHVAITVAAASLITIYWDGVLCETIAVRGRPFSADDVSWAQLDPNWLYHPMTIDDVVVVRQALDSDQIAAYVKSVRALRVVRFPTTD